MTGHDLMAGLPGEQLIRQGLADFQARRRTIAACLIAIARPRLRQAGLLEPDNGFKLPDAELVLYGLLRQEGGDAYSRYNSLLRELISFEMALDRRLRTGSPP